MKNLIIFFCVVLLVTLSIVSCDEATVDIDPIGDTEAGWFQNEDQMTQSVFGIYQKVCFFHKYSGNSPLNGIWLLPCDNLTAEGSHAFETFTALNGSNGRLNNFYKWSYQLIARANTVLQKIEENGDFAYALEPELKDYHKGEALFLRSWMNWMLWNTYGTAPVVTERILDLDDAYPPNSSGTQLLDQAIIDLELAAQLLPDLWEGEYKGRVTKNSARALQGKILVFRGFMNDNSVDYSTAISLFNSLPGAALMPNYGDNFNGDKENNEESFFEYQANNMSSKINPWLDNDAFSGIGDIAHYLGMYNKKPGWIGNDNVFTATQSLINAYEVGDPRIDYNIDQTQSITNVVKYLKDGAMTQRGDSYSLSANNPRMLRYADILLLKAEALVRSGGSTAEAIGLINEIRTRARMSTADGVEAAVPANRDVSESNATVVLDWIFTERRLELAMEEGHRWYDLRRRHIKGEIDLKTWDFSSKRVDLEFQDYNVNFPLPDGEVINSPNLNQNTGY